MLNFCLILLWWLWYTVVNIWSGSKKFIKVVLSQERILVLGFRTTLIKGFDPLQMLTSIYLFTGFFDHLFDLFYTYLKVFAITFDQFNGSLLNKSIDLKNKKLTDPKLLNSGTYHTDWMSSVQNNHRWWHHQNSCIMNFSRFSVSPLVEYELNWPQYTGSWTGIWIAISKKCNRKWHSWKLSVLPPFKACKTFFIFAKHYLIS